MLRLKQKVSVITSIIACLVVITCMIQPTYAQDTLVVQANTLGALNDAIDGDTLSDGTRANPNRVYKLTRDGFYPLSGTIRNVGWHLNIYGEKGTATQRPPVISVLLVGNAAPARIFDAEGDITLKNIYINGITPELSQSRDIIRQRTDSSDIVIENCIMEFQQRSAIFIAAAEVDATVKNSLVRNTGSIGPNPQQGHFLRYIEGGGGTATMINNTYHSSKGLIFPGARGDIDSVIFDHNTVFNATREPNKFPYARYIRATNNLYVNVGIRGSYPWINAIDDPDALPYGIFNLDTLDANGMTDADRDIYIANNNYFLEQQVMDYFAGVDSISPEPFMNQRTLDMIAGNDNMVSENNTFDDPQFVNPPDKLPAMIELYQQFFGAIPVTDPAPDIGWYEGTRFEPDWPILEDLSYTANIVGTDGLPVGDLDWYSQGGKHVDPVVTGINEPGISTLPDEFSLKQNYPNPFNPETTIEYQLKVPGTVSLAIYNITGQKIQTLVSNQKLVAGQYSATWNGQTDNGLKAASGIYFYRLQVSGASANSGVNVLTRKMILLK